MNTDAKAVPISARSWTAALQDAAAPFFAPLFFIRVHRCPSVVENFLTAENAKNAEIFLRAGTVFPFVFSAFIAVE